MDAMKKRLVLLGRANIDWTISCVWQELLGVYKICTQLSLSLFFSLSSNFSSPADMATTSFLHFPYLPSLPPPPCPPPPLTETKILFSVSAIGMYSLSASIFSKLLFFFREFGVVALGSLKAVSEGLKTYLVLSVTLEGEGIRRKRKEEGKRKRKLGSAALAEMGNIAKRQVMSPESAAQW